MANAFLQVVEDWTGARPITCPWKAFFDQFVGRVMDAYRFFEAGNLSVVMPNPSHRLVEGVSQFHAIMSRITNMQIEQDRKAAREKGGG